MNKAAPKGVDPEKHESCVLQVKEQQKGKKKKVNPWAVCTASLKKAEETAPAKVEPTPEAPKVEATEQTQPAPVEAKVETTTPAEAPKAPEQPAPAKPKLSSGLFQGFTLGTTLKQGNTGNVITNVKPSKLDYEKAYQSSSKNVKMTSEELQNLGKKK